MSALHEVKRQLTRMAFMVCGMLLDILRIAGIELSELKWM